MFRKACIEDLESIAEIYELIHAEEECGKVRIGWERAVYPTRKTAEEAIRMDDMFLEEINGQVVAAARINQVQVPEYVNAAWKYDVPEKEVMVLHTLVVSPAVKGKGYGTAFVEFYEKYALQQGCHYLRMDTNEKNAAARRLYRKLGYDEVSIVPCVFNGIAGVQLVCLEKKI